MLDVAGDPSETAVCIDLDGSLTFSLVRQQQKFVGKLIQLGGCTIDRQQRRHNHFLVSFYGY